MKLSAIVIGSETLTRESARLWRAAGHEVSLLVTAAPALQAWAVEEGLACAEDWTEELPEVDVLLSIANLRILPPKVLAKARLGAVNFHDGPLPEHAGLNAPVWALLQGEARHGVTWHRIEGGIDQGRVLVERAFEIAEGETALTLNTRCFEAGLESFPEVIAALEQGLLPRPQRAGPSQRHRRADRPAAQGLLDFTKSAAELARLLRALDHGSYWNPLTTAKIAMDRGVFNAARGEEVASAASPAGRIIAATAEALTVTCSTGALRLSGLSCQKTGGEVSPETLAGAAILPLGSEEAAALERAAKAVAPREDGLRHALLTLSPLTLPEARESGGVAPQWQSLSLPRQELPVQALALLRALGSECGDVALAAEGLEGFLADWLPLRLQGGAIREELARLAVEIDCATFGWPLDLMTRDRGLRGLRLPQIGLGSRLIAGTVVTLGPEALHFDASRLAPASAERLAARLAWLAAEIAAGGHHHTEDLPALTPEECADVIHAQNAGHLDYDCEGMLHHAFAARAEAHPQEAALLFENRSMSYGELERSANRLAHLLRARGVKRGDLVGLCLPRGFDMIVGALAIWKAGAAYVPMDPSYPAERLALFAEDSRCTLVLTHAGLVPLLPEGVEKLCLDQESGLQAQPEMAPEIRQESGDLAYLIYTSGSTGRPKGVMVSHRNVANFFAGMDMPLLGEARARGTWLAVTSMSFDISVLELFWTLTRGFKLVIASDEDRRTLSSGRADPAPSGQGMDVSLYYWGNDDGAGAEKYRLLLEGARFADRHGFAAVWTPERHFHAFGGPYPNPSVTGAAVAAVTRNLAVRAGSVVAPLHHPARIAEEWAVIDNLTEGRAGLAFASGWHPDDFILRPENAPPANKDAMLRSISQVRALWRGEAVDFPKADGTSHAVKTQPRPVSPELPVWVTTAGNPETWREAGRLGANVLTHLLGQSIAEVAEKIGLYHAALREAGHDPAAHKVTLMLHTFLAATREEARRQAEAPMKAYLAAAAGLVKQYAWAFPAFKKPAGLRNPMEIDLAALSPEENAAILDYAFERYFEESGLFGTVEDALARVAELQAIGVGEIACLIDFGIAPDIVLDGLRPLAEVVARVPPAQDASTKEERDFSLAAQMRRHGVTHLQCTPSMARMLVADEACRLGLARLRTMLVGGEALAGGLVRDLQAAGVGRLLNMYGPTETTIWSSLEEVAEPEVVQNIGKPLPNQQFYVLDALQRPLPIGVEGELWIGGEGVTQGYWQRPDLTAERFRRNPFASGRIYRTGDLVRRREDGKLDYLGRTDHQVKLRGYRIETGEIEAALEGQEGVEQALVMLREDQEDDLRLVAYVTGTAEVSALREALARDLPAHMLPAHYVRLDAFPLTPNGKIDRTALPAPLSPMALPEGAIIAPPNAEPAASPKIESKLATIWARVLGVARVGARDNFFSLGGHSLLAVQAHREIASALPDSGVTITDIFRFPILGDLTAHLSRRAAPQALQPLAVKPMAASSGEGAAGQSLGEAMARRRALRLARRGVDA